MTQNEVEMHRKNLALLIETMRENLLLRQLLMQSFPDDWSQRIVAADSDPAIQNSVTVQMAQVLEGDRRLKEILRMTEGLNEGEELPRRPTQKPH
jgi:hypothetical protein